MKIIPFYQTCMHACLKMHKVIIIRPQSLTFTPFLCLCYVKHNSFIWDKKGQNISSGCHWCVSDLFVKVCCHSICRIQLSDNIKNLEGYFCMGGKLSFCESPIKICYVVRTPDSFGWICLSTNHNAWRSMPASSLADKLELLKSFALAILKFQ